MLPWAHREPVKETSQATTVRFITYGYWFS
jgi:hypothetical protein